MEVSSDMRGPLLGHRASGNGEGAVCTPGEPLMSQPSLACRACGLSPPQAWAGFFPGLFCVSFLPGLLPSPALPSSLSENLTSKAGLPDEQSPMDSA